MVSKFNYDYEEEPEEEYRVEEVPLAELAEKIDDSIATYKKMSPCPERNAYRKMVTGLIMTYNKRAKSIIFKLKWF